MKRRLIVYARRPLPGYAKSRLGAVIGEEQAAGVYARLLYGYLLDLLHADWRDTRIELAVAAPTDVPFFVAAFPELEVYPQIEGDLGQRMANSFEKAFAAGATTVVLTGSDIPDLNSHIVQAAFDALESAPLVIGPASDGGYYLIGMRVPDDSLFDGIVWGGERVLAQTESLAQSQGLALAYLPELDDVDIKEEFQRWRAKVSRSAGRERPDG